MIVSGVNPWNGVPFNARVYVAKDGESWVLGWATGIPSACLGDRTSDAYAGLLAAITAKLMGTGALRGRGGMFMPAVWPRGEWSLRWENRRRIARAHRKIALLLRLAEGFEYP